MKQIILALLLMFPIIASSGELSRSPVTRIDAPLYLSEQECINLSWYAWLANKYRNVMSLDEELQYAFKNLNYYGTFRNSLILAITFGYFHSSDDRRTIGDDWYSLCYLKPRGLD